MTDRQQQLLTLLDTYHTGRHRPITARGVMRELDMPDDKASEREVQRMIERLRNSGHAICASVGDPMEYFIAANQSELDEYERTTSAKVFHMLKALRSAVGAARFRQVAEQMVFDIGGEAS